MTPQTKRFLGVAIMCALALALFALLAATSYLAVRWVVGTPPFGGSALATNAYAGLLAAVIVGALEGGRRGRKGKR